MRKARHAPYHSLPHWEVEGEHNHLLARIGEEAAARLWRECPVVDCGQGWDDSSVGVGYAEAGTLKRELWQVRVQPSGCIRKKGQELMLNRSDAKWMVVFTAGLMLVSGICSWAAGEGAAIVGRWRGADSGDSTRMTFWQDGRWSASDTGGSSDSGRWFLVDGKYRLEQANGEILPFDVFVNEARMRWVSQSEPDEAFSMVKDEADPEHLPQRKIHGRTWDARGDLSKENLARLAASKSEEEAMPVLQEMLNRRVLPNALITARHTYNRDILRTTFSDAEGKYQLTNLPEGDYEVWAQTLAEPAEKDEGDLVSPVSRIRVVENNGIADLELLGDLITVKGLITDTDERPIPGAKVTGTLVPVSEVGYLKQVTAVSGDDGSYELCGLAPVDLWRTAGYLSGGNLKAPPAVHNLLKIQVEAEGYVTNKGQAPEIPLVTEARAEDARRLLGAMRAAAAHASASVAERMHENPDVYLPASQGNTIVGIDIVLEKELTQSQPNEENSMKGKIKREGDKVWIEGVPLGRGDSNGYARGLERALRHVGAQTDYDTSRGAGPIMPIQ